MSRRIHTHIEIARPRQEVFAFVDDPAGQPRWVPGLSDVYDVRGEGAARRYNWTFKMAGVPIKGSTTTTEWVDGERIVENTGGAVASTWTYEFADAAAGTRVDLTVEYTINLPFVGRFAEPLLYKQHQKDANKGLQSLKRLLERG